MINRIILLLCAYLLMLCGTAKEGGSHYQVKYNIEYASSDNIIIDNIERQVYKPAPQYPSISLPESDNKKQKRYRARIWTKYLVFDIHPQPQPIVVHFFEDQEHYPTYSFNTVGDHWSELSSRGPPASLA